MYLDCPRCHASLEPEDKRCLQCGADLVGIAVSDTLEYRETRLLALHRLLWSVGGVIAYLLLMNTCFRDYTQDHPLRWATGLLLVGSLGGLTGPLALKWAEARQFR